MHRVRPTTRTHAVLGQTRAQYRFNDKLGLCSLPAPEVSDSARRAMGVWQSRWRQRTALVKVEMHQVRPTTRTPAVSQQARAQYRSNDSLISATCRLLQHRIVVTNHGRCGTSQPFARCAGQGGNTPGVTSDTHLNQITDRPEAIYWPSVAHTAAVEPGDTVMSQPLASFVSRGQSPAYSAIDTHLKQIRTDPRR